MLTGFCVFCPSLADLLGCVCMSRGGPVHTRARCPSRHRGWGSHPRGLHVRVAQGELGGGGGESSCGGAHVSSRPQACRCVVGTKVNVVICCEVLQSGLCVHVIIAPHAFFAVVVELTGCVPSTICVLVLCMLPLVLLHCVAPPQWRSGAALPTRSWWASVGPQWARCRSGRWSGWSGGSRRSSGPSMGSKGEWSVCVC